MRGEHRGIIMKRIYVTLDTEMDNDSHWGKHFPPKYTSITEGIPQLLRPIWDKYNVHPIYFVSPEVLYYPPCVAILQEEIKKGAVIGAHLHPEYIQPERIWGKEIENHTAKYPCLDYPTALEKEKLKNLTALIKEKLGVQPIWYRAARFGADADTIEILRELGYKYDSSVTPGINWVPKGGPDHSKAPLTSYPVAKNSLYEKAHTKETYSKIIEKPVTILGKRWGIIGRLLPDHWLFYRWLRPTHMTYWELRNIVREMFKLRVKEGVMMFHSMEIMVDKTPYVRTKWMQKYYLWRLEKILQYAEKKGYQF